MSAPKEIDGWFWIQSDPEFCVDALAFYNDDPSWNDYDLILEADCINTNRLNIRIQNEDRSETVIPVPLTVIKLLLTKLNSDPNQLDIC